MGPGSGLGGGDGNDSLISGATCKPRQSRARLSGFVLAAARAGGRASAMRAPGGPDTRLCPGWSRGAGAGQVAAAGSGARQGTRDGEGGLESWGRGRAGGGAGVDLRPLGWQKRGRTRGLQ
eukprot:316358-Chlamydomonas_euryale.AAC.1